MVDMSKVDEDVYTIARLYADGHRTMKSKKFSRLTGLDRYGTYRILRKLEQMVILVRTSNSKGRGTGGKNYEIVPENIPEVVLKKYLINHNSNKP